MLHPDQYRIQVTGTSTAELAVESLGEGAPFVWSHALMASMAQDLDGGVLAWRDLADAARIIRLDARGHGQSDCVGSPEDYSWHRQADSLWEVIDALGEHEVILGGASMGCGVSLHAACSQPERVRGLVLVIPPRAWEWREGTASAYRMTSRLLRYSFGLPLRLLGRVPFPEGESFRKNARGVMARDLARANPKGLAGAMLGAAESDFPSRDALSGLQIPTLILAWPDDDTHPLAVAQELDAVLPQSKLRVVAGEADPYGWPDEVRGFIQSLA